MVPVDLLASLTGSGSSITGSKEDVLSAVLSVSSGMALSVETVEAIVSATMLSAVDAGVFEQAERDIAAIVAIRKSALFSIRITSLCGLHFHYTNSGVLHQRYEPVQQSYPSFEPVQPVLKGGSVRGEQKNSPEKGQTAPFVVRLSLFVSLLLPFLIPMIIFERAQDIILGFVVGNGRWDELP